jgi:hypothetical protein
VTFDVSRYDPKVATILGDGARLADLGPGTPDEAMRPKISAITDLSPSCLAGLWLYHDFLDESHLISQEIESPTGSFWHAIMHRREPDPSNSKYWWRRVGSHPVQKMLVEQSPSLGYNYNNPFDFVDFCEHVRGTGDPDEDVAKQVQRLEWQLLFGYCFRSAAG